MKNAGEGLATPRAIVPWTLILLVGQIIPFGMVVLLLMLRAQHSPDGLQYRALQLSLVACGASLAIRIISTVRFRQSILVILLHPLAVLALLMIQWQGAIRRTLRRPAAWRGRTYPVSDILNSTTDAPASESVSSNHSVRLPSTSSTQKDSRML